MPIDKRVLRATRIILVHLVLYGLLTALYIATVLRLLSAPLTRLYSDHRTTYAWVALALIAIQGATLEMLTTFLLKRLRLFRLE